MEVKVPKYQVMAFLFQKLGQNISTFSFKIIIVSTTGKVEDSNTDSFRAIKYTDRLMLKCFVAFRRFTADLVRIAIDEPYTASSAATWRPSVQKCFKLAPDSSNCTTRATLFALIAVMSGLEKW